MNQDLAIQHFMLDQDATIQQIINALSEELRPMHYREAYDRFMQVSSDFKVLAQKTDGAEKLRQWFAETNRGVYVDKGYLYLTGWLSGEEDQLFRKPVLGKVLNTSELEDCMYDLGRRFEHMLDKKGTAETMQGVRDRQRRAKLEWSVSSMFRDRFFVFYRDAENRRDYKVPCDHDFALQCGPKKWKFDVKEFTRETTTILVNTKPSVTYILAEWKYDRSQILGFIPGSRCHDLRDIQFRSFHAKEATICDMIGIESLMVFLNMRMRGQDLASVRRRYMASAR